MPDAPDSLDRDTAQALLEAVDAAFTEGLRSRYGGGVSTLTPGGDGAVAEAVLRPAPPALENMLVLGLSSRDNPAPGGTGLLSGGVPTVPLGTVAIRSGPTPGAGEVHVETELFDEADPNGPGDAGTLPTGLLVGRAEDGLAVLRSESAIGAAGLDAAQGRRGWLPRQGRGQVNRGGGLGSNGFRRAAVPSLPQPAAHTLLNRLGERVAGLDGLDLERLVVGFRLGPAGTS